MSITIDFVQEQFQSVFGSQPDIVVRAPGRVNIIGEHTDYNHGFVLPMALERETLIAARKREDRVLDAYAANMEQRTQADLDLRRRNQEHPWMDYIIGVADELTKTDYPLHGADLLICGDVPLGCGLSSSAALEMAALCMFEALGDFQMDGAAAAQLGQRVENNFLGLSSGIMDQFISRCGKAGHGLFLDCRSYNYDLVPISLPDATFVVANTCCARGLTASKYNERVAECAEAVAALRKHPGNTGTHLRDFTLTQLETACDAMSEIAFRRARHVITENERTQKACVAMQAGDAETLGQLMNTSDESLRKDYEVTSAELDAMTATARSLPGCLGARMTGAGFGGCTINLVKKEEADAFGAALLQEYHAQTGLSGELIVSNPADGAGRIL